MSARLALILLVSVDLILAAGIWIVVRTPLEVVSIAPPQRSAAPRIDSAEPQETTIDLQALERNHVLARPLFAETRRAWQPPPSPPVMSPPPVEPQTVPVAPAPRLVGIGISGGRARALLADPDGIETVWVDEGETAFTWTVREIKAGSVTLEQDDRVLPLELYPERAGG